MPTPVPELETPVPGLLAAPPSPLPYQAGVQVRSFVLRRPAGTVVVYNSPGLSAAAPQVRDLGRVTHLLVNHEHEAMHGPPDLDAPVFVHELDRRGTARSLPVAGVFTGRASIGDDLEVIPTPGHTRGTTSYLWDSGEHRFLFTGDFLWIEDGAWRAVVLEPRLRADYVRSLELVRELDFDVLVPWGSTGGTSTTALVDAGEKRDRVDAVIARVRAGQDR